MSHLALPMDPLKRWLSCNVNVDHLATWNDGAFSGERGRDDITTLKATTISGVYIYIYISLICCQLLPTKPTTFYLQDPRRKICWTDASFMKVWSMKFWNGFWPLRYSICSMVKMCYFWSKGFEQSRSGIGLPQILGTWQSLHGIYCEPVRMDRTQSTDFKVYSWVFPTISWETLSSSPNLIGKWRFSGRSPSFQTWHPQKI